MVQEIAPTPDKALETGIKIAAKIAACGPLEIKTTLASAHLAIDSSEAEALSELYAQYGALYRTEDFKEGRSADRSPKMKVDQAFIAGLAHPRETPPSGRTARLGSKHLPSPP